MTGAMVKPQVPVTECDGWQQADVIPVSASLLRVDIPVYDCNVSIEKNRIYEALNVAIYEVGFTGPNGERMKATLVTDEPMPIPMKQARELINEVICIKLKRNDWLPMERWNAIREFKLISKLEEDPVGYRPVWVTVVPAFGMPDHYRNFAGEWKELEREEFEQEALVPPKSDEERWADLDLDRNYAAEKARRAKARAQAMKDRPNQKNANNEVKNNE